MSALTADAIVDRVRSVCASSPFLFTEAETWDDFSLQPASNIDAVFRIPPPHSEAVTGGFGYTEDRTDVMQIWVARQINQNYPAVRQALLRDVHSLTAAVVRDGLVSSGDYSVPDAGRGHAIEAVEGATYVTLTLTLPINYDAQL